MALGKISVIIPAHNEARVLRTNILRIERELERLGRDFEIIISEDGSTDGTVEIAKALEGGRIRVLNYSKRLGKGSAIMKAVSESRGDIVIFMDADLASDLENIPQIFDSIDGGASLVIGSRYVKGSESKRKLVRWVASRSYNWLVRILLGSRLRDHQCGFKAFRKSSVMPIAGEVTDGRWFWDTELLIRAQRRGLIVKEMPIKWEESQDSKFDLLKDTWHMAASLARFKMKEG
ncbi:glycosyltransferase family 2 protein [Candidatus Micrarchaeota archaeon]|nr:glycosyltransferase family 2 protein [Candidatus Micrarchaeota archaeon]